MSGPCPETLDRFRAYFREHIEFVVKSLRRLGVRDGDCEDVAHELFLAVYQRFAEVDEARSARAYLFGFARKFASAYRNSARYRREIAQEADEPADSKPNGEEVLLRGDRHQLVYHALDQLEPERREIFVMFELDERTMEDIATELSIPFTTVVSRLRQARRDFEAALKRLTARSPSWRRVATQEIAR